MQDVVTLERRSLQGTLPGLADEMNSLAVAPDGRTLYFATRQGEANIWMVEQKRGAATAKK